MHAIFEQKLRAQARKIADTHNAVEAAAQKYNPGYVNHMEFTGEVRTGETTRTNDSDGTNFRIVEVKSYEAEFICTWEAPTRNAKRIWVEWVECGKITTETSIR